MSMNVVTEQPMTLIRKRDVADQLSVSVRHVENLIARGELRAVKIGKCVRFRPEDLDAYLANCVRKAAVI